MLNDKDHAEKHLRAMHRELARLETRRRHPPVHELHPPIQRGWKRHFILTPAARLRPDTETLAAILECLNTVQYFWRPDFRRTRRQQRTRRRGTVAIEQELMAIHWRDWEKEPVPPAWRKYFRREFLPTERFRKWPHLTRTDYYYPWSNHTNRHFDWGYAFHYPAWLELKVEKHWLTHCTEIEPGVAGRIAEIERWMNFHRGRERFQRLKGRSQWWRHYDQSAQRRDERQIERETRAHLGFVEREAAEHIPSKNTASGGAAGGMSSAATFPARADQIFCGSEAGNPSLYHRDRHVSPAPALRARAVGPVVAWEDLQRFPPGTSVRTGCPGGFPPASSDSPGSSKRTGRVLRPAFSAKHTPGALVMARPGHFF